MILYHYFKNGDGRVELYNFKSDPFEQHDLADSAEEKAVLREAQAYLREQFRGQR